MSTFTIRYYSLVGEPRGTRTESIESNAATVRELLHEIQAAGKISLTTHISRAILNEQFVDWDVPIQDGDHVTFLPPFSGG